MKKQIQLRVRGVSVVVLAVMLLLTGCRTSTDVSKPAADEAAAPVLVVATPNPVASPPQGGLPQEGIQVHGHWTIEVRNPDGTVAEVREFENALQANGALALAEFLGRINSVGGWIIGLGGTPWESGAFVGMEALIGESTYTQNGTSIFSTLTVSVPSAGANANKLVLSGTATAYQDGNIGQVSTYVERLLSTEAPSATYPMRTRGLTRTQLATPINLLAGQQVLVTVVISFS